MLIILVVKKKKIMIRVDQNGHIHTRHNVCHHKSCYGSHRLR